MPVLPRCVGGEHPVRREVPRPGGARVVFFGRAGGLGEDGEARGDDGGGALRVTCPNKARGCAWADERNGLRRLLDDQCACFLCPRDGSLGALEEQRRFRRRRPGRGQATRHLFPEHQF